MRLDYILETPASDPRLVCDILVSRCPVEITASGYRKTTAFVRFRADNDQHAVTIARQTEGGTDFTVHTGYGIHRRRVFPEA